MSSWRVILNSKLWNQEKYENNWRTMPECRRLPQSKGNCVMKVCPKKGDSVAFVFRGNIVMRGVVESDGFISGIHHTDHSCNLGDNRPHADGNNEFAWVQITEIGLNQAFPKSGQRTWCKIV
jgi:hypothetical protein